MKAWMGIAAGVGLAAWVYSKLMRSSGGNTQSSLIIAGVAAVAAFLIIMLIPIEA